MQTQHQSVENERKNAAAAFDNFDKEVKKIIAEAHGAKVACPYVDKSSGDLGAVVSVTYYLAEDGKVKTFTKSDPIQRVAKL